MSTSHQNGPNTRTSSHANGQHHQPASEAKGHAQADTDSTVKSVQSNMADAAQSAKEAAVKAGEDQFDQAKGAIHQQIDAARETTDAVTESLREGDQQTLAQYTSSLSNRMADLASGLQNKSAQDVIQDVVRIAKRNPAMFIAGSVAAGFALARYVSASSNDRTGDHSPSDSVDHSNQSGVIITPNSDTGHRTNSAGASDDRSAVYSGNAGSGIATHGASNGIGSAPSEMSGRSTPSGAFK